MEYDNPEIPEGINTSKEHPLKEFFLLVVGVTLILASAIFVLSYSAQWLAHLIPFTVEQQLTATFETSFEQHAGTPSKDNIQQYLQQLANRIAKQEDLPPDMSITVHFVDNETVNAFATLGGHIIFHRGLLEKLPDENTLAMVMGHEIAHVKHRHPIEGVGRAAVISIVISMVSGASNNDKLEDILGNAGLLTALSFSREQESEADATALAALVRIYGHVSGAQALFDLFQRVEAEHTIKVPQFLSTHPLTENRIASIKKIAVTNSWAFTGEIINFPDSYANWLSDDKL